MLFYFDPSPNGSLLVYDSVELPLLGARLPLVFGLSSSHPPPLSQAQLSQEHPAAHRASRGACPDEPLQLKIGSNIEYQHNVKVKRGLQAYNCKVHPRKTGKGLQHFPGVSAMTTLGAKPLTLTLVTRLPTDFVLNCRRLLELIP